MSGPPKWKCHSNGFFPNFFPWADTGQGCIEQGKLCHAVWMLRHKGVADHVTDVVGDQFNLVDMQRVEQASDIFALGLLVVAACRM
jgi:hypothetical protein